MEKKIFQFFADYIYKKSGILYIEEDFYRLTPRLQAVIKHFGLNSLEDLCEMYQGTISHEMHSILIDIATNNETYFLRDIKPFKALGKVIIGELLEGGEPMFGVRIWSAGCSTGQEVWSILLGLDSFSKIEDVIKDIRVDGTDISSNALERARKGNYDLLEVQRGLPAPMLIKYFTQEKDESWTINSDFKKNVHLKEHNLLADDCPKGIYHVIFCRNVLIYQDQENRAAILQKLYDALRPGGYLFLGTGESMIGMKIPFEQKKIEGALVYQK